MKNYDVVLFDLDGTLTDPGEGITNSVIYSLKKYNISLLVRRFMNLMKNILDFLKKKLKKL